MNHPIPDRVRPVRRSPGSGLPWTRRRFLRGSAAAGLGAFAIASGQFPALAQDRDPYQYIRRMEPTTDLGQLPGQGADEIDPVEYEGRVWDAYIQVPIKEGQDFHFTCEFDSAWIILRAYGHDMDLQEQLEIVGHDLSIEPYYEEQGDRVTVWGGDIAEMYSGHYDENVLARARGSAVRKVFEAVDLSVSVTPERDAIEEALLLGRPVFFKSTVDFLDWRAATWIAPDGDEFPVVLTNDHALVVMGFDRTYAIIRDPLGPTTTNTNRPWQYRVTWDRFLEVIAAQGNDALSVGPSEASARR